MTMAVLLKLRYIFNAVIWASLVAQRLKHLPAMQEAWVRSLGWEDPLEKGMATHSSNLTQKIPWTEELGSLQSMGSQRVRHDSVTSLHFTSLQSGCTTRRLKKSFIFSKSERKKKTKPLPISSNIQKGEKRQIKKFRENRNHKYKLQKQITKQI